MAARVKNGGRVLEPHKAQRKCTVQVTAPAETADLIDRLRASGAVLIYDPQTRTIRASGSDRSPSPQARTADTAATTTREEENQLKHAPQPKARPG